jgi:type I restriction enzyme R subunit
VAWKITEYLESTDPYAKTIVFCEDIDHAERMRQALVNLNPERVGKQPYVMRITGDDPIGKAELDNFIDPEAATRSSPPPRKLMTTGVDAQTCKLIVLDQRIQSMTEFKQIIGRGTRINEDYGKFWFTIMDFKKATELFADPDFDGDPSRSTSRCRRPAATARQPGEDGEPPPDDEQATRADSAARRFPVKGASSTSSARM